MQSEGDFRTKPALIAKEAYNVRLPGTFTTRETVRAWSRPQFLPVCMYSGQAGLSLIFATEALIFIFNKASPISWPRTGRI